MFFIAIKGDFHQSMIWQKNLEILIQFTVVKKGAFYHIYL